MKKSILIAVIAMFFLNIGAFAQKYNVAIAVDHAGKVAYVTDIIRSDKKDPSKIGLEIAFREYLEAYDYDVYSVCSRYVWRWDESKADTNKKRNKWIADYKFQRYRIVYLKDFEYIED